MAGPLSRAKGRSTRTFRRMRARLLAESDTCAICGHGQADSADHIISRAVAPELAEDEDNLQPAHHQPCPTCGRRCQNEKGTRPMAAMPRLTNSCDWFGQHVQ